MSKSSVISFRITQENKDKLCRIQEKSNIDKSKILNYLIENFESSNDLDLIKTSVLHCINKKKIVVYLSNDEYTKLKQSSIKNLRGSVARELKFYALNAIYETKIPDSSELKLLNNFKSELCKIGSNINQIAKIYNTQLNPQVESRLSSNLNKSREIINCALLEIKTLLLNKRRLK